MGIKSFFKWFQSQFNENIIQMPKNQINSDLYNNILLIDMNGLIHNSVAKSKLKTDNDILKELCNILSGLIFNIKPIKVYLCIDGIAPLGKQMQQRQRRFGTTVKKKHGDLFDFDNFESFDTIKFDTNSISPGTEFMHNLGKKIAIVIKQKQSCDWKNIEIIFSNDKVPGEGEHKIIKAIKKETIKNVKFIIYGSDADLIMLSLICREQNPSKSIFILRDKWVPFGMISYNYLLIDIGSCAATIKQKLSWNDKSQHNELIIYDFVILCFLIGNDFVPQIPTCEMQFSILDFLIEKYKQCKRHLNDGKLIIPDALKNILIFLYITEESRLNSQLNDKNRFQDIILEKSLKNGSVNRDLYDLNYTTCHFRNIDAAPIFLQTFQWVFSYYTNETVDFNWYYPYYYAPTLKQLINAFDDFNPEIPLFDTIYHDMFEQLLSILPSESSSLLPEPLDKLLHELDATRSVAGDHSSKTSHTYIDYSGKHYDWEGIVIPPNIDKKELKKQYDIYKTKLSKDDLVRNKKGFVFRYINGIEYIILD